MIKYFAKQTLIKVCIEDSLIIKENELKFYFKIWIDVVILQA